jgi:PTS hybrid protein
VTGTGTGTGTGLVGVVLVSHSAALAEAAADLARAIGPGDAPVLGVGGTGDGGFGTSPGQLAEAIEAAEAGAGVLLVPDLGSSMLAARAVLDERGEATGGGAGEGPAVRVVDAPFLEGAIAAVIAAGAGLGLAEVAAAAEETRGAAKF